MNKIIKLNKKTRELIILVIIIIIITVGIIIVKNNINPEEGKIVGNLEYGNNPGALDENNLENAKIENGKKINVSKKLSKEKKYNGLIITDIKLESDIGVSKFTANVKNNTDKKYEQEYVYFIFVDNKKNELGKMLSIIPELKANSSGEIVSSIASDILNAKDFKIELVK